METNAIHIVSVEAWENVLADRVYAEGMNYFLAVAPINLSRIELYPLHDKKSDVEMWKRRIYSKDTVTTWAKTEEFLEWRPEILVEPELIYDHVAKQASYAVENDTYNRQMYQFFAPQIAKAAKFWVLLRRYPEKMKELKQVVMKERSQFFTYFHAVNPIDIAAETLKVNIRNGAIMLNEESGEFEFHNDVARAMLEEFKELVELLLANGGNFERNEMAYGRGILEM